MKAHFVVDTSRNGNGRQVRTIAGAEVVQPARKSRGRDPTTSTPQSLVDAYLWVKEPSVSDGACRAGAPPAGEWWPEYALELVRNEQ